jgi:hypothetical protein
MSYKKELANIEAKFKQTYTECPEKIGTIKSFISDLTVIFGCIVDNVDQKKMKNSLTFSRFLQSMLHLDEILLLSMSAYYTSGTQILRYYLESIIQASYLDQRHPSFTIENKLCILTEISDKREYFVSQLLDKLLIEYKENVRKLYKDLSMGSHPSHLDFPTIDEMMKYLRDTESKVDCEELDKIAKLTIQTYDAIFFFILQIFPDVKASAKKNVDVGKIIKKYNLPLLEKTL